MSIPVVPAAEPADRRTGLVLFGVLDIVVGLLYLIRTLAVAFLSVTGASPLSRATLPGELPVSALLALAPTAFFLAIGIGSIVGRRWARSLSLAFSSLWLAFDVVTGVCLLVVLPRIVSGTGQKPPFVSYGFVALFGLVLPGAYVLFYRSPRVKAACEWLDPQERWTDRCPGPVLAAMMLLALGAGLELAIGFSASRQMVFLGRVLGGGLRLAVVGAAVLQIAIARGLALGKRWAGVAAIAITSIRVVVDVLIVRGLTIDRIERAASSVGRLSPHDRAGLEALRPIHLGGAIAGWVVALGLLSIAVVVFAGRRLRTEKSN